MGPSEEEGGADRDAARSTTHLPESAPRIGSPAPMTHAEFAARCSNIASIAAAWSRDSLTLPGYLDKPIGENSAAGFLKLTRQILDNIERDLK